ncbi:MAG: hypothetical protein AAF597_12295, partial [Bacteroidota bacterium]
LPPGSPLLKPPSRLTWRAAGPPRRSTTHCSNSPDGWEMNPSAPNTARGSTCRPGDSSLHLRPRFH